jgi:hypothetical protein
VAGQAVVGAAGGFRYSTYLYLPQPTAVVHYEFCRQQLGVCMGNGIVVKNLNL